MLTIRTNNVPRKILKWWDLSEKEKSEFDYLKTEFRRVEAEFVRYRGWVYDLGDMERNFGMGAGKMPRGFEDWDNYLSDSFFSGILIRYVYRDFETKVICATYFS